MNTKYCPAYEGIVRRAIVGPDTFYRSLYEIRGEVLIYNEEDKAALQNMLLEIKEHTGWEFYYLTELCGTRIDLVDIGIGEIVMKHIRNFSHPEPRAYLYEFIYKDKVKDRMSFFLEEYEIFKQSPFYLADRKNLVIGRRLDQAMKHSMGKKDKTAILEIISNPIDAYYCPQTVQKYASWKYPEFESLLHSFLLETYALPPEAEKLIPPKNLHLDPDLRLILQETALYSLRYYPTENNIQLLEKYVDSEYGYLKYAATHSLKYIRKRINNAPSV